MNNGPIEKAIHNFRDRRLRVYKADPTQIIRDTRVADRTIKDHSGRWLFELLQNCDDASASEVQIAFSKDAFYLIDNGSGIKPGAVAAISGTDLSDKTTGTIGRKGVGFKAVYEVSQNPQLVTVKGEGIEFSPKKTKKWLNENNLFNSYVPFQWIPFNVTWDCVINDDPRLGQLNTANFNTVVRLPGLSKEMRLKTESLMLEWPPHALFAFRHIRRITAPGLVIELSRDKCTLHDSRHQTRPKWKIINSTENPPDHKLATLGVDERRTISKDGVGFLVAAPLDNDRVVPNSDYLPIHVFYPTEQKSPVCLLLHAEFLVKSDRTALIPLDDSPFNTWVADRLAQYVCDFVNDSFCPNSPSSHVALLVPFEDRQTHPVTDNLWQRIAERAWDILRLAGTSSAQQLTLKDATLISVSIRADLARTLLEATDARNQMLHDSFDEDESARKALKALSCNDISDQDLITRIEKYANSHANDEKWVWTAWEWLAEWVLDEWGDERKARIEIVKSLPIIPINGSMKSASNLADWIVTWKPDSDVGKLPNWLPLTFVDNFFRDRIKIKLENESPVNILRKELGITEPGPDLIQHSVGQAIKQFWKDRLGDPGRFLQFILDQDWHETTDATRLIRMCPVPLSQPVKGDEWGKANETYFGLDWGNDLLDQLYNGITGVAWVANIRTGTTNCKSCKVLEWVGVANYPRIIDSQKKCYMMHLQEDCDHWQNYLRSEQDFEGRHVQRISNVSKLDHLRITELDPIRGALLIRIVAKHWNIYYKNHMVVSVEGTLNRERYYRSWQVMAKWWWEICERLTLQKQDVGKAHRSLMSLWLPDKRTKRIIGKLLPIVDLKVFETDKDVVQDWLLNVVRLRTRIEQLSIDEWKTLLSTSIPQIASSERLSSRTRLQDSVIGWYVACLNTVRDQEISSDGIFTSCPLICHKGKVWQYVKNESRYLDDDNSLASAFANDIWLFNIPTALSQVAVEYFGVLPLSESVEVNVTPSEPQMDLSDKLESQFRAILPFVWAWRSSQSMRSSEKLLTNLKELQVLVVPSIIVRLVLGELQHEVEQHHHVQNWTILLHKDHVNEAELAIALAKALNVKSEADFYENLLRCTTDRQRNNKLLSKGISKSEIARCLREYNKLPDDEKEEKNEDTPQPNEGVYDGGGSGTLGGGGKTEPDKKPKNDPSVLPINDPKPEPEENVLQPIHLKDTLTTPYSLGEPPSGVIGGGNGRGGNINSRRKLTEEEKLSLEHAGRVFAERELQRLGFSIEQMPQKNPGFDIRAMKEGVELRIEVKSHLHHATVVDVTHREYQEYLHQQDYSWELWNVDHLVEEDSVPVTITRYDRIPDDALNTRTYRVDLKRCKKSSKDL